MKEVFAKEATKEWQLFPDNYQRLLCDPAADSTPAIRTDHVYKAGELMCRR